MGKLIMLSTGLQNVTEEHIHVPIKSIQKVGKYIVFSLDTSGIGYTFRAGKSATLAIPSHGSDDFDLTRIFSIASSTDDTGTLRFATIFRKTSKFKTRLSMMEMGDMVDISPPSGGFFLISDRQKPLVFITSEIGVTPVISILNEAVKEKRDQRIFFVYLNATDSDELFMDEFEGLSAKSATIKVVKIVSNNALIDLEKTLSSPNLKRILGNIDTSSAMFYLSGKPKFVYDVRKVLASQGISVASMKTEKFSGY